MTRQLKCCFLLIALAGCSVSGAEYIRATMTVTSAPSRFGAAFTVNGSTRIGSNIVSSTSWVTNVTAMGTATNILNHSGVSPFGGGVLVTVNGSNVVFEGIALTASVTTDVGTLILTTNTVATQYSVQVPFDSLNVTNRTNNANHLIYGISTYGVSNFGIASRAFTNFVNVGLSQTFSNKALNFSSSTNQFLQQPNITNANAIGGTVTFLTNGIYNGGLLTNATPDLRNGRASNLLASVSLVTNSTFHGYNSYLSNVVAHTLTVTNLSVPGTGSDTLQIGTGALATNDSATALGDGALAGGAQSTAVGQGALAYGASTVALGTSVATLGNDIAIGNGAFANSGSGIAIGSDASTAYLYGIAIGVTAVSDHHSSVALGAGSLTTTSNQVMLGTSSFTVNVPGRLITDQCLTNVILAGTNRTYALGLVRTNNSGLANGDNAGIKIGQHAYVRISGPTASYGIVGIGDGYDGRIVWLQKNDAYTVTIKNDSGVEPTSANRIYTGTGADVTFTNNPGTASFIYDGAASRWILTTKSN